MSRRLDENGEWMDYDKDQAIINDGDQAKLVPVELKDHSKDPVITDLVKEMEKQTGVPAGLVTPVIEKKKRGRPKKVKTEEVKPLKEWYCSTCKEYFDDKNVMKIGAGTDRWAVFCNMCQRSFGFQDQEMLDKVAALIKNNPTK